MKNFDERSIAYSIWHGISIEERIIVNLVCIIYYTNKIKTESSCSWGNPTFPLPPLTQTKYSAAIAFLLTAPRLLHLWMEMAEVTSTQDGHYICSFHLAS